jgi:plastocyanin
MYRAVTALAAVIVLIILAACNDKLGEGNTCKSSGAVTVELTASGQFVPASVTIAPTQRVCWQNQSGVAHTVTSAILDDSTNVTMPNDYTYTKGFGKVQDFYYYCSIHNTTGVVFVR